jgi:hypothetical protein
LKEIRGIIGRTGRRGRKASNYWMNVSKEEDTGN